MPRSPYAGPSRKLVLGFDVGTTFCGVSYAFLDPGQVPEIKSITRFPSQEHLGTCKVPSIAYYDNLGTLQAIGAEAVLESTLDKAEDLGWFRAEWWKLALAPRTLRHGMNDDNWPPPLPPNKTVTDILSDFLRYLFDCAKNFVCESHAAGELLWSSIASQISFVFSHPNGWEGIQQSIIRRAAARAGLIDNTNHDSSQVTFVTEGEASFNFCVNNGIQPHTVQTGQKVLVIDAGGGTIDISKYVITKMSPLSVEETNCSDCLMNGSEFVTFRAAQYLHAKLAFSPFGKTEDIRTMVSFFDASTKRLFKSADESLHIKFGTSKDSDPDSGIARGRLKITGQEVASFYQPSITEIFEVLKKNQEDLCSTTTHALLVGGFGTSPWLFQQLKSRLATIGINLARPDGQTNKAVAEGAVSFFLDHFVTSRITKFAYGTKCKIPFKKTDPDHSIRSLKKYASPDGCEWLPNGFSSIVSKGTKVAENKEFSRGFQLSRADPSALNSLREDITCYKGTDSNPRWMDVEPSMYTTLCHITADTSKVPKTLLRNPKGQSYYRQDFKVILLVGLTEMKAQLGWTENGQEKRNEARIVYHDE